MVRCGVNMIGLDNLRPFDARLAAQVWSWAPNEPAAGGSCAYQNGTGFFRAGNCRQPRRAACRIGSHFAITTASVAWWNAAKQCARIRAKFTVPATAQDNEMLKTTKGSGELWLNYADRGRGFIPNAA